MAETNNKKPGFFSKVGKWFREMRSELKKVVWPSRKQLINNTLIVLGAVLVVGIIVVFFDWIAGQAVSLLRGVL